jgi:hypothetical protein
MILVRHSHNLLDVLRNEGQAATNFNELVKHMPGNIGFRLAVAQLKPRGLKYMAIGRAWAN